MTVAPVVVVGASGRVGSALVEYLGRNRAVVGIARGPAESTDRLAVRVAAAGEVVVNAAGVAHVQHESPEDLLRLEQGNVALPIALAAAAAERGVSMVHVSSVKALTPAESPYAESKQRGEFALAERFSVPFESAGLSLVVLRPVAMLFPPFDAGRLARLRFVRHIPRLIIPPVRLPVITAATFLEEVEQSVVAILDGTAARGLSYVDFGPERHGTLRDVRDAMRRAVPRGGDR